MKGKKHPGKQKRSCCQKVKEVLLKLDLFGRDMDSAYNIEGIKLFKSLFGTVLSIIFLAVLLNYTVYKFNSMKDFNDTNLFTSHQENYFAEDTILKGGKDSF